MGWQPRKVGGRLGDERTPGNEPTKRPLGGARNADARRNDHRLTRYVAFGAGHGVEAPVHPVNEVHVGRAWRTIKGIGPHGATRGSVAGEIMLAEIRLRFDDPAACRAFARSTLEDGAEKVARDDLRRPI